MHPQKLSNLILTRTIFPVLRGLELFWHSLHVNVKGWNNFPVLKGLRPKFI